MHFSTCLYCICKRHSLCHWWYGQQARYQVKPQGDRPYRLFWCPANINQYACQNKFREWHHDQTGSHTTGLRYWTNSTNDHTYMSEASVRKLYSEVSEVSVIYRCHRLYSEMLTVWVYHTKTTCYNSTCIFVTRMYNRKIKRYISSRVKSRQTIILCNFDLVSEEDCERHCFMMAMTI